MVVGTLSHIDDPVQACITVSLKSALYQTYSKTRRYFSTITKKCITLILTAKMASVEGTTYSHSIKTFLKPGTWYTVSKQKSSKHFFLSRSGTKRWEK